MLTTLTFGAARVASPVGHALRNARRACISMNFRALFSRKFWPRIFCLLDNNYRNDKRFNYKNQIVQILRAASSFPILSKHLFFSILFFYILSSFWPSKGIHKGQYIGENMVHSCKLKAMKKSFEKEIERGKKELETSIPPDSFAPSCSCQISRVTRAKLICTIKCFGGRKWLKRKGWGNGFVNRG